MSGAHLLWRRANKATLDTLRGDSGGQYDIRLGRSQPVAGFFAGLPQVPDHEGVRITIVTDPTLSDDTTAEIPGWELVIRRMSSESKRRDWYIRAQRPVTAHPAWRQGAGPEAETQPEADYVLLLRTAGDRFFAGWLRGEEAAAVPTSLLEKMEGRDVNAVALEPPEEAAVLDLIGATPSEPAESTAGQPGSETEADPPEEVEQGMAEALEGRKVTVQHVRRERSRQLRREKIKAAGEHLRCEACSFDFAHAYGERGRGFIECHHLIPVSELNPATPTRLEDLALLCANCHRMVHAKRPWLSIEELNRLLDAPPQE
jgi:5-methylcytosine-specific restriction endonuclease McrA